MHLECVQQGHRHAPRERFGLGTGALDSDRSTSAIDQPEPLFFTHTKVILAELLAYTDADGANGDTMSSFDPEFWRDALRFSRTFACMKPRVMHVDIPL